MKTKMLILGPWMLLAGLLVGTPAAQASTLPPTLVGETFVADRAASSFDVTGCPGSGSLTVHYVGTASGPYPGTFVEDVSVAVGLLPDGTTTLAAFHATFTITSATGAVTGTKDLASGATGTAFCYQGARRHVRAREGFTAPSLTYSARISSGGHAYTDAGTASATDTQNLLFTESFLTSQGLSPTAKDQCKKDGWMDYPQYKNQGQCIAYVNHSSKD